MHLQAVRNFHPSDSFNGLTTLLFKLSLTLSLWETQFFAGSHFICSDPHELSTSIFTLLHSSLEGLGLASGLNVPGIWAGVCEIAWVRDD